MHFTIMEASAAGVSGLAYPSDTHQANTSLNASA